MLFKKLILITALSLSLFSCGQNGGHEGLDLKSGSIINGEVSSNVKQPWQVSLQYSFGNTHFCGGSLVTKKLIITAAHCVESIPFWAKVLVRGGSPTGLLKDAVALPEVEEIVIHNDRSARDFTHDIALIYLEEEVELTEHLQTISLPSMEGTQIKEVFSSLNQDNVTLNISGWGLVESPVRDGRGQSGGKGTKQLMDLNVRAIGSSQYDLFDADYVDGFMSEFGFSEEMVASLKDEDLQLLFINGKEDANAGSCQGDSGGPLTVTIDDGNPVLIGVTSFGMSMNEFICNGFSAYVDVQHYIPWIASYLASKS